MKFEQYVKLMENFYCSNFINEKLNFNYDIKRITNNQFKFKWMFKIDGDLYTIDAGKIKEDTWDITFSFTDESNKETITSLTDKNIPLKILSAVATAIKELITEIKPKNIELTVFGDKKSKTFLSLIKHEIENNKEVGDLKNYTIKAILKKSELVDYNIIILKRNM